MAFFFFFQLLAVKHTFSAMMQLLAARARLKFVAISSKVLERSNKVVSSKDTFQLPGRPHRELPCP